MTATTTYRAATQEDIDFFRTHGYIVVRDVIDPAELDSITALCDQIIERKETMAFDWAWEKGTPNDERDVQDPAVEPHAVLARRGQWRAVPHVGGRLRLCADGPAARVLVRPVPRQAAAGRARATLLAPGRGLLGSQPRRPSASRAGCRCTTSTRRTAACTSSTAATATACSSIATVPSACRAICSLRARRVAGGRVPDLRVGGVTFHHSKTPHMTNGQPTDRSGASILTQHLRSGRRSAARATTTRGRST